MSRKKFRLPNYLHHKQRDRGRVYLNGKFIQMPGRYGSDESKAAYQRLCDELLSEPENYEPTPDGTLVVELMLVYLKHADDYYRSDEPQHIRRSLKPFQDMYSRCRVDEIGPLKLDAVRARMASAPFGWSRQGINKAVGRIVRMFKWGVSRELVRVSTWHSLKSIEPLKRGRSSVFRESEYSLRNKVISYADVEAVREHVLPEVWAMVQVQWLSGMRPGEVCGMTGSAIDRREEIWVYRPISHKNAWRGKSREIYLGTDSQRVLIPFMVDELEANIFSPKRAMQAKWERGRRNAQQPLTGRRKKQIEHEGFGGNAIARLGDRYTEAAYRRAVKRGCKKAGVTPWTPYMLRHTKADAVRAELGIEGVAAVLGNSVNAAQIYAERNRELAIKHARMSG